MLVTFHGTRGSIPVCDAGFQEFGGNTTCVSISSDRDDQESVLVFDAGTGIRNLGKTLIKKKIAKGKKIFIAFSHFHWDHIQGFPFFAPAYDPSKEIEFFILSDTPAVEDLKAVLAKQMESTYFPISLDNMGAKFTYAVNRSDVIHFDGGTLSTNKHNHPGGAYGYRLEVDGKIIVYCSDIEHGESLDEKVITFCQDADMLIHDAQYTPEELLTHRGWGHSSWEQAIEVAERANVKNLYLTHHDPDHNDDMLRNIEKECQERFTNCFLAREGQSIRL